VLGSLSFVGDDMSGDIKVSENRWWMKAGWAFRSVLESALGHLPDSTPSLKSLVDERIRGWNYLNLETECTTDEVRVFLNALREGYKDTESAGPGSFGDPSYFPSYMKGFAQLIRMIEEELDSKGQSDSGGSVANIHE
jgi:hypothetical protein